jgi:hypothetical protein
MRDEAVRAGQQPELARRPGGLLANQLDDGELRVGQRAGVHTYLVAEDLQRLRALTFQCPR